MTKSYDGYYCFNTETREDELEKLRIMRFMQEMLWIYLVLLQSTVMSKSYGDLSLRFSCV